MRFSGYPSLRGPHHALGTLALLAACLLPLSSVAAASAQDKEKDKPKPKPISLDRTGGFQIGGKIISDPTNPNMTLSCDHGYMEYFIPSRRRARRASSCGTARARRCGRTGGTLGKRNGADEGRVSWQKRRVGTHRLSTWINRPCRG